MDKINKLFPDCFTEPKLSNPEFHRNPKLQISDKRVAQLLLVLHELDESVAGFAELPKTDLSDLVSSAIVACGFVDPGEARYAIAAVLDSIETRNAASETFAPD